MASGSDKMRTRVLLRELLQGHRARIARMVVVFLVKMSPEWVLPICTARMIDLATTDVPDRWARLAMYLGIIVVSLVQNVPTNTWYISDISYVSRGIGRRLRMRICQQLQALTLLYHNRTNVGQMQAKAIRDVEILEDTPRLLMERMLTFVVNVIAAMIAVAVRAPMGVLFFVVAVPLGVLIRRLFISRMRRRAHEYRESVEHMSASLADMMVMMPLTRAHGLEHTELDSMHQRISNVADQGQHFDKIMATFTALSYCTMHLLQVCFLAGSIVACIKGHLTVGDVVMFNSFFIMLSGQMSAMLYTLPQITKAREAVHSISEVLDAPDLEDNSDKQPFEQLQGRFEFDRVRFTYPDTSRPALDDLSLTVKAGESVAFVGPSGSGKSTILSMILGFLRPDAGTVAIDGYDICEMDLRTYRRFVGVVTQESVFFSGTVRDNVAYGNVEISDDRVREALDLANALEFVDALPDGVHTHMGAGGIKLSGGQQQRLAIARAIIRDPRILVLDEATSALDMESEMLVQDALEYIMRDRTTFIVAHRISTVRSADRIVVLDRGTIADIGSPKELLERDNFYSRAVRQLSPR